MKPTANLEASYWGLLAAGGERTYLLGHCFLKGYPCFSTLSSTHAQPGGTKFIQNKHIHMKLGGKVIGVGRN